LPGQKPPVWFWYVGYCVAMALLYLFFMAFMMLIPAIDDSSPPESVVVAIVIALFCFPLFLLYAVAPFLPRTKFAWYYGFVTICIGFTSCCTLPFAIALLIFWLKPETRAYLNAF
jgi:hypothetical protein